MDSTVLTKLLYRYFRGQISRKDLEGRIFQHIKDNYHQFRPYNFNQDDYMDYLCWLYPRISRAIDHYHDQGATFDAYIGALVHWSIREYRTIETEHHIAEYACWKAKALDEAAVNEEEPEYLESEPAFDSVPNPRQMLVLLLKSYQYMSPDFLERAAPALGVTKEKLSELVDQLRILRLNREEEIRSLQERIYSQFYRCIIFEKKLLSAAPRSSRYERMKRRLGRARKRLDSMRRRLAGMKTGASNRQVAEILNSAKGTVDAQLHAVKEKYEDKGKDEGKDEGKEGHE
ncbi:hypothetical protein TREPR_3810 [Treponema primitia ZAS-2]|uniref:Uncharacterized protein n=1 Tax=Treponema primitia (strain ATCC BAA-887 / DSM 12427 / ZAS-2) TaxID=545694 RepID=F5YPN2_TREPZ|nr:hypothetical protein [Treponema primitia]AEF83774.1 hypothetical protein TREPR_3810 [Treponema primitia ZAS-2]